MLDLTIDIFQSDFKNELMPEFMGLNAMNSFAYTNSASRGVMFGGHYSQHLVLQNMEEKIIYSGLEPEMAKYTLGIRMPENGRVIETIPKYPPGVGYNSLAHNPETLVIYEKDGSDKEIDCFILPYHVSHHQTFGWKAKQTDAVSMLYPNSHVKKGTVFADTPGVIGGNSYAYGRNPLVAYMSISGVAEDGFGIARSEASNWAYNVYETRIVEWGSTHYPINSYGTQSNILIFPELGSFVKDDGSLMKLRQYDPSAAPVDMGIFDMMEPDYTFDRSTYVRAGGGRVIDIEIIRNNSNNKKLPTGMSAQADKYADALIDYYLRILSAERRIRLENKRKFGDDKINLSPRFQKLLVYAMAIAGDGRRTNHNQRIKHPLDLRYRKVPIDEYYAKFVIEYTVIPNKGDKFSDEAGGGFASLSGN